MSNEKIALKFVDSLVPTKFDVAKEMLSPDSVYQYASRKLTGENIILSFMENHRNAIEKLDGVDYGKNKVESTDGSYVTIMVEDILSKNGKEHIYNDRLIIKVENDLVTEIIHKPIYEQREKLQKFLTKVGVKL